MTKFNILKTIDFDLLDKNIKKYVEANNKVKPHIFANSKTVKMLMNPIDESIYNLSDEYILIYENCKVYIDPELEDGFIELR